MASSASKKRKRNISTGDERTKESPSMEPRSCWEDLNLDILMKIFDGISFSDLSCNISSVCCSWQLACWYTLCWANKNNLLDLGVIRPALANAKFKSSRDGALMKLLKSLLDDNDTLGNVYLENWRLSIRTLLFPEDLEISDDHLIYVWRKTKSIDRLVLLGSSGITGRGFANAVCNWRNVNSIHIGKFRYRYFDQIVEEIGRNCSAVLDVVTLSMRDFYLTRSAASVIAENLVRVKILRFEGVCVHRDGINRLFNDCHGMQEIQLCGCFLMEDDDLSNLKATINVNFALRTRDRFQEWGFCNNVEEGTKGKWRNWLRSGVTVPMMMELNVTFKGLFPGGF